MSKLGSLKLFLLMAVATVTSPLAAPPTIFLVLRLLDGDLPSVFLPLAILTLPGMYGYALAFVPVLVLGVVLTASAREIRQVRPFWVWATVGALSGITIALMFAPFAVDVVFSGAAAGAACASIYRLIVGRSLVSEAESPTG